MVSIPLLHPSLCTELPELSALGTEECAQLRKELGSWCADPEYRLLLLECGCRGEGSRALTASGASLPNPAEDSSSQQSLLQSWGLHQPLGVLWR